MSNRILLLIAVCIFLYISFLQLNVTYWNFSNVFLGVIQELITIPILIGQVIILVISITRLVKEINWKLVFASILTLTTTVFTIISFIDSRA